eukprot:767204-Hanusia_phi.AAC.2
MRTNWIASCCCRISLIGQETKSVENIQHQHALHIKPVTIEDIDSRVANSNACFQEWRCKYKQSKIDTGFDGKFYIPPDEGNQGRLHIPLLPGSWARLVQRKRRRFLNGMPGRQ